MCLASQSDLCYAVSMDSDAPQGDEPPTGDLEKFAEHTRRSLILKLSDWQDRKSWDEFYRTYWRPIYSVAIQSGLREHEAWDVVQEVVITIAKQSRKQAYDPKRGSFKAWLWKITSWRISDQFRARAKDTSSASDIPGSSSPLDFVPDMDSPSFEDIWDKEWQDNVMKAALDRVKMKISPRQFQIFDYNVIRGMKPTEVHRKLGVSLAQVYLAKHRVSALLKKEAAYIRSQGDQPGQAHL